LNFTKKSTEFFAHLIIQDINDEGTNKSMLYGAKDIYELKERLSMYENMKRDTGNTKDKQKNKRCYNCGDRDHLSANCPAREKGMKCFKWNQYSHIAANLPNKGKV